MKIQHQKPRSFKARLTSARSARSLLRLWRLISWPFYHALKMRLGKRSWELPIAWQRSLLVHFFLLLIIAIASWQSVSKIGHLAARQQTQSAGIQAVLITTPVEKKVETSPAKTHVKAAKSVKPMADKAKENSQQQVAQQEQMEQKRLAALKLAEEKRKVAKLAAEKQALEKKKAKQRAEKARKEKLQAQKQAEAARVAKEKLEKEKAEKAKAEKERQAKAAALAKLKALAASNLQRAAAAQQAREAEQAAAAQALQDKERYLALINSVITNNWINPFKNNGVNLSVILLVTLDATGNVTQVSVEQSSGNAVFDRQVVEAVRRSSPLPVPADTKMREHWFKTLTLQFDNQ